MNLTGRERRVYDVIAADRLSLNQIGEKLNLAPKTAKNIVSFLRQKGIQINRKKTGPRDNFVFWIEPKAETILTELKTTEEVVKKQEGIYDMLDKLELYQSIANVNPAQKHIEVDMSDKDSIYLCGWGDLHLENLQSSFPRMKAELKMIKETKNMYVVFLGDAIDNPIKYQGTSFDDFLPPKASREVFYKLMEEISDKLLCMVSGCHERHGEQIADYDSVEEFCKRKNIPWLGESGEITMKLKNSELNIVVAHKYMGYSMYNPFHPLIRAVRENFPHADILFGAHTHRSAIAIQTENAKQRAMVMIGTRKIGDRYAERRGFRSAKPNLYLPVLQVRGKDDYCICNDILNIRGGDD